MFGNIFVSVSLYVLSPIGVIILFWWLYKEIIKLVKPETVREKQKTIIAWLIIVFPLFSIVIIGILDNLKVVEPGSFLILIAVVGLFISILGILWIESIYRHTRENQIVDILKKAKKEKIKKKEGEKWRIIISQSQS